MDDTTDDCASIFTRIEGDVVVVTFTGAIDVFAGPSVRDTLSGLISAGHRHLVLELEDVLFMDSSGLGALIGTMKKARDHHGSVRLVCSSERSAGLLRITGLSGVIPVYETTERAAASVRSEISTADGCVGDRDTAQAG
ncbi:STAS domain-containing protein [Sporichthya polymorpha]|uniref:STAS domain-containing protein n=1 Tax=Sporichthya polymorpha TaxID=35751 RepID=UPI0003772B65|nr:STAS domain-containing protein [Sporichthya polymorpha]